MVYVLKPYQNMDYVIIKKLLTCRYKEFYTTYSYMKKAEVAAGVNRLFGDGLFRHWTFQERLESLTVPVLKNLLISCGIPAKGKKADLVSIAMQELPVEALEPLAGAGERLMLTEAGEAYFNFLKTEREREYDEIINSIRTLCLRGDYNLAYHTMCLYETRQFFKRGMGTDWEKHARNPIPDGESIAVQTFMKQIKQKENAATAVAYHWMGDPSRFRGYLERHPENFMEPDQLHYGSSILYSFQKLFEYRMEGHAKYKIIGHDEPCVQCKTHREKKYPVNAAQIGVNCPPFHVGCRCSIVAVCTYEDGTEVIPVIRGPKKKK